MAVKRQTQTRKKTRSKTSASKRSSTKRKNTLDTIDKINQTIHDTSFKLFVALLLVFFAIFLLFAFFSYTTNWTSDQSIIDSHGSIIATNEQVDNSSGSLGASIAHLFLFEWFGIPSFAFILLLVVLAARLVNLKLLPVGKTLKYVFLGVLWTSVTLSFIFGKHYLILGGAYGYHISTWLTNALGKIGSAFILIITLLAFILFSYKKLASMLWKKINPEEKLKSKKNRQKDDKPQKETNNDVERVGVLDLDTNEIVETVDRKELLLHDDGKVVDKSKAESSELGFEVENTIEEKTEISVNGNINSENSTTNAKDGSLVLSVEKNKDIEADEIIEQLEDYDPTQDLSNYKSPPIELLDDHRKEDSKVTDEELLKNKNRIVETLKNYKIEITRIKATIGPTITLYEIVPAPGVRISKIKNLEDDIALSLAALGIRIIAPMPGKGTVGIEVPNQKPEIVSMRSVISSMKFQTSKHELPIALGKTISNESYVADLTKMPHLLVAGATGQGKSVGLNAIITSLIYKKHPSQLKFVFVDPKKVELSLYEKIEKHFLAKLPEAEEAIITDNSQVVHTLNSLSKEMDSRYDLLKLAQVRNIKEYNQKFITRKLSPLKGHRFMPYIVLVVDEFADLIITAGKEVEMPIARLAQLARAIGIHLIIATQRPSTNIITGVIKANFPTRIAFKVASMIDSRTILDSPGANQLIGRGDMLITEGSELVRLQCAFIDTPELDKITNFVHSQQAYPSAFLLPEPDSDEGDSSADVDMTKLDDLFEDAARMVVLHQQGSTSLIQRKLSIGYNRAGRIIDQLEAAGIVGSFEGSKARQVLIPDEYALEQFLKNFRV